MKKIALVVGLFVCCHSAVFSQNPFKAEVQEIQNRYINHKTQGKTIVFTGSSSIRMWLSVSDLAPENTIINTGFGGSQARDLWRHKEALIIQFQPHQVFIYEGDNDLYAGVKPRKIKRITKKIIRAIHTKNKQTQIVLIAAKPSISRWDLKIKYERLNGLFKQLVSKKEHLVYADVWNPMLKEGALDKSLFISDGLHMNQKGYDIWKTVLKPLILK
tara:strand:+ start:722 stop:1369 length:648 start_codon:yes stop_codon:yes gene_type:complete